MIVDINGTSVDATPSVSTSGRSLSERARAHIRHMIFDGALRPGDRVHEQEIAHALGMSRGPVREAIRSMSSSGLVVAEANHGARVVSLAADDIAQLYDVREALEARAAQLAAERMTATERNALLATLAAHDAQMTEENSTSYPRGSADWDFHLMILRGARNEVIWRICGDELRDLFLLLRGQHGLSPGRGRKALEEHRWIAEAIVAGRADLAALLMANHLRSSRDNLLRVIADSPVSPQANRNSEVRR